MKREQAIEIARSCAKAKPQSYYSEPFQPHEWVIDAMLLAVRLYGAQHVPNPQAQLIETLEKLDYSYADNCEPGVKYVRLAEVIERVKKDSHNDRSA